MTLDMISPQSTRPNDDDDDDGDSVNTVTGDDDQLAEPSVGFKNLLSRWKTHDQETAPGLSSNSCHIASLASSSHHRTTTAHQKKPAKNIVGSGDPVKRRRSPPPTSKAKVAATSTTATTAATAAASLASSQATTTTSPGKLRRRSPSPTKEEKAKKKHEIRKASEPKDRAMAKQEFQQQSSAVSAAAAEESVAAAKKHSSKKSMRAALRQPKNVYQQPLKHAASFVPPKFSRTYTEQELIRAALRKNFVFSDLTHRDLVPLVAAFEKCSFAKGDVIIRQGDAGDYFYIIETGKVSFVVQHNVVGKAGPGASFGELALLYTCPRAATVCALAPTTLFRVDQHTFRHILQHQTRKSEDEKKQLLQGVNFLAHLTQADLATLSRVMTPRVFQSHETLVRKGDPGDAFYVIEEGQVLVKDISVGSTVYADQTLGPREYFGERALATNEPRAANVVALTKGVAFSIDRATFEKVLGTMSRAIEKAQDTRKLAGIETLQRAGLDQRQLTAMSALVVDRRLRDGKTLMKSGAHTKAALYFVREGIVTVTAHDGVADERVSAGGYLGMETMVAACGEATFETVAPCTAKCLGDCVIGRLLLSDCRSVFDVELLAAKSTQARVKEDEDSVAMEVEKCSIAMADLERHVILGEGTFGQVWLVSKVTNPGPRMAYALKIQSKRHLIDEGQADAVIAEKNILARLKHPFIVNQLATYQDDGFVYFLLELLQGGELFSLIHHDEGSGLGETKAKFYGMGVSLAIEHMHSRRIVYRDLKPENVMIKAQECVMTRGHDWSADHWSLGILIYEMITGENPFYFNGMDQMTLFRSIVQDDFSPADASEEANDVIARFLVKDPNQRLGSLLRGESEIFEHPWFADIDAKDYLLHNINAPWQPAVRDRFDTSCFDDWSHLDDKAGEEFEALSPEEAALFDAF